MGKNVRRRLSNVFARKGLSPATFGMVRQPAENHPGWLALAALAVVIVPMLPFGNYVIYPFFIMTTWFHEMGHGLTALLLGLEFEKLVIFPNGSGYALTYSPPDSYALTNALVSLGGPIGPAFFGSLLILASQTEKTRKIALVTLAAIIILSTAIWVRSIVGWAVLLPISVLLIAISQKSGEAVCRFAVQFLGINAALSMFSDWDYLLSESAVIGGAHQRSDTGAISSAIGLPTWFWAGFIIVTGSLMIGASLYRVLRARETKWVIR